MDEQLRQAVRQHARRRCEYCHLAEAHSSLSFEIEHIIAEKHGGESTFENLAWACRYCNSYKGSNIAGIDPASREIVPLFHPRRERWEDHFCWNGPSLTGLTPGGRATVAVLRINQPELVALRQSLIAEAVSFR
jgi:hypothetical protein